MELDALTLGLFEKNIIYVISLETKKNNMNNFAMSNESPPKHRVPYVGGYAIV